MGARTLSALVGALLLTGAGSAEASKAVQRGRTCTQKFRLLPYLTQPTTTSIRINVIPEDAFDIRWSIGLPTGAYGVVPGVTAQVTQSAAADTRTHGVAAPNPTFTGLTAGTQYKYMVECRTNATSPWQVVNKAFFKTLNSAVGATEQIAVVADSHTTQFYIAEFCDGNQGLATIRKTISNLGNYGPDFIVDLGDTANTDHTGSTCNWTYPRENGTPISQAISQPSLNQADAEERWEIYLDIWQPILAYAPIFISQGNHEWYFGWGGVGAGTICGIGQDITTFNLAAYKAMLGNYNDAYPADTGDMDGDGNAEVQNDGLYYEFASGSLRWFIIDNMFYSGDLGNLGATPAAGWPGFVARTADIPPGFGAALLQAWTPGADTAEDNTTLGAEQTIWFRDRTAAMAEAFGAVSSHRPTGGVPATGSTCYWYQRGGMTTRDIDGDGRREIGEPLDTDGDGDLSDEHYILDRMVANGLQMRFLGHDHVNVICRRNGIHMVEVGVPHCPGDRACDLPWVNPSGGVNAAPDAAMRDGYDCDEDGFMDQDPTGRMFLNEVVPFDEARQNQGLTGANGTAAPGYGALTVNANTTMQWRWILTDKFRETTNNDVWLNYGPITP